MRLPGRLRVVHHVPISTRAKPAHQLVEIRRIDHRLATLGMVSLSP